MDVIEAAERIGVTPRRVRAMINDGRIVAHRVGSKWVIDELASPKERRALSVQSWQKLTTALKQRTLAGLSGQDRIRTAARIRLLRETGDPARLLREWRPHDAPSNTWGDNLFAHAEQRHNDYLKLVLRQPSEYLRSSADLAQVATSERIIRGLDRRQLAEAADVDVSLVRDIETARPLSSPGQVRRVLRVLSIEPTALPHMVLT